MRSTNIIELAEEARRAGLFVSLNDPAVDMPDTAALLGVPLDPELEILLRAVNGCLIGSLQVYGVPPARYRTVELNLSLRRSRDDFPPLHDLLVLASFGHQALHLATMPIATDAQDRQPVVIVDANEDPYLLPLASSVNRALHLVVTDEIRSAQDPLWREEPFPDNMVAEVAKDARLIELIRDGAFAGRPGMTAESREWCDSLLARAG